MFLLTRDLSSNFSLWPQAGVSNAGADPVSLAVSLCGCSHVLAVLGGTLLQHSSHGPRCRQQLRHPAACGQGAGLALSQLTTSHITHGAGFFNLHGY